MYKYASQVVAFDGIGIHKLRSGLAIKTIPWHQVTAARIAVGMDYNNWFIMLLLGSGLVLGGLWMMANTLLFLEGETWSIYWFLEANAWALTIGGLGALMVALSLRRTMVLEIQEGSRKQIYSLREIAKRDEVHALAEYVRAKLPPRAGYEFRP
jgi:hypothetical protein